MPRRLLIVRHCESTGLQPQAPLSPRGHEQARTLAVQLAELRPQAIVSSPFLRARQSVEPLADACALPIAVDDRLAERQLACPPEWEFRDAVRQSMEDFDWQLPGGESSRAAQRRARQAIDALLARDTRLTVVATHGQLLTLILHSIDASFGYNGWESLSHPDLYVIEDDGPNLRFRHQPPITRITRM